MSNLDHEIQLEILGEADHVLKGRHGEPSRTRFSKRLGCGARGLGCLQRHCAFLVGNDDMLCNEKDIRVESYTQIVMIYLSIFSGFTIL